ncbi:unnamed protein product [Arabis nemorensis]|uniref:Uncharacterized protein n=1 Tax=Arabis nemorensis TaxID=586526 RepID=A0A565CKD1_9BRAS|nr:unnamed protein product [Arabis nemorensis]
MLAMILEKDEPSLMVIRLNATLVAPGLMLVRLGSLAIIWVRLYITGNVLSPLYNQRSKHSY